MTSSTDQVIRNPSKIVLASGPATAKKYDEGNHFQIKWRYSTQTGGKTRPWDQEGCSPNGIMAIVPESPSGTLVQKVAGGA